MNKDNDTKRIEHSNPNKDMKTIKEQQTEYLSTYAGKEEIASAYEAGALCVCNMIEEYMANLNLGATPIERFYKFDILADIYDIIDQLKK
jgi:hypothetical protein